MKWIDVEEIRRETAKIAEENYILSVELEIGRKELKAVRKQILIEMFHELTLDVLRGMSPENHLKLN